MRAAIAIGSNSTRMLAANLRNGELVDTVREREETRLFLGMDENNNILPERLEATAQAVLTLARKARAAGAKDIALLATSATRDAANSDALARRIRELTGLELQVIPGEEEARLAFRAAAGQERRLVMDIGGGSTEWTLGEKGQVEWAVSAQLGCSRLYKVRPVNSLADAQAVYGMAEEIFLKQKEQLDRFAPAPGLIGMGGTCTAAASIQRGRFVHGIDVDGDVLTRDLVREQWEWLSPMSVEERKRVPGLPLGRVLYMPHGLSILLAAMTVLGFDRFTVSGKNNTDGYLLGK